MDISLLVQKQYLRSCIITIVNYNDADIFRINIIDRIFDLC